MKNIYRRIALKVEVILLVIIALVLSVSTIASRFDCQLAVCIYLGGKGVPIAFFISLLSWPIGVFGIGSGIRFRDWTTVAVSVGMVVLPFVFFMYVSVLRAAVVG
jgi:hypothetical protein